MLVSLLNEKRILDLLYFPCFPIKVVGYYVTAICRFIRRMEALLP